MYIRKIPYYISSFLTVMFNITNPYALLFIMLKKPSVLHFKNGASFLMTHPSDVLITKETLFDDVYRVHKLKKANTIVDVGGGIGEFSIMCALKFPHASIYAFEPDKKSFDILTKNVEINRCANISAIPKAVGKKKHYTLYISEENDRSSTAVGKGERAYVKGVRIQEITKKPIDLLKIDVEGAELDVLQSIREDSYRQIACIVLEFHNYLLKNVDMQVKKFLEQREYQCEISYDPYNASIGYIYAKRKNDHP